MRLRPLVFLAAAAIAAYGALAVARPAPAPWGRGGEACSSGSPSDAAPLAGAPGLRGRAADGREASATAEGTGPAGASTPDDSSDSQRGCVAGHVVRGLAGKPVLCAMVRARRFLLEETGTDDLGREPDLAEPRGARTDGEGAFALPGLPAGLWWIDVRDDAGGSAEIRRAVRVLVGEPTDVGVLRVEDGARLRGRVLAPDGVPAAGAAVWAVDVRPFGAGFSMDARGDVPVVGPEGPRESLAAASADETGVFSLDGVPAADLGILARSASGAVGWVRPVRTEAGRTTSGIEVRLATPTLVSGTVLRGDGTPAVGAFVISAAEDMGVLWSIRADGTGRFRAPVGFVVAMDAERRCAALADLATDAGEVTVRLPATGRIVGRMTVAACGAPATSARVTLFPFPEDPGTGRDGVAIAFALGAARMFPAVRLARSSPDGAFALPDVWASRVRIRIEAQGFAAKELSVEVPAGGTTDLGDVALEPGRTISGIVLDAAGKPVRGVSVRVLRKEERLEAEPGGAQPPLRPPPTIATEEPGIPAIATDRAGRFSTPPLAPGTYDLGTGEDWTERTWDTVQVTDASVGDLRILLKGAATIRTLVLDATGRPAEGVPIRYLTPAGEDLRGTTGGGGWDGRPATLEGRWAVAWDSSSARTSPWPGEVGRPVPPAPPASALVTTDGKSLVDVTLRLPPLATVRGRLRVGERAPSAVTLSLVGTDATSGKREATTDATGAYVFRHVEPGTYRFEVPGYPDKEGVYPVNVSVPDATERDVDVTLPEPPAGEGGSPWAPSGCGTGKCG